MQERATRHVIRAEHTETQQNGPRKGKQSTIHQGDALPVTTNVSTHLIWHVTTSCRADHNNLQTLNTKARTPRNICMACMHCTKDKTRFCHYTCKAQSVCCSFDIRCNNFYWLTFCTEPNCMLLCLQTLSKLSYDLFQTMDYWLTEFYWEIYDIHMWISKLKRVLTYGTIC